MTWQESKDMKYNDEARQSYLATTPPAHHRHDPEALAYSSVVTSLDFEKDHSEINTPQSVIQNGRYFRIPPLIIFSKNYFQFKFKTN